MVRFIFIPLALLASLVFSCEKEVVDLIAPIVLFENLDGSAILENSIALSIDEEATFVILIEDESNIRDISYRMSVNNGPDEVIDQPGYLQQVESSANHKVMTAEIPFNTGEYSVGDLIRITVTVSDPFGNNTAHSLTIELTE